ncbi:MAG: SH3 domain-containing protein, partial [Lachnospiraceae bacterium]|nr:SH3 domain-containing protein [Lachnospiraceae bacterium]
PTPSDQNNVQVTPMQSTVYAATQNGLNVRSGPSTKHSKIGTLQYGQAITVTGKTADNWYQIKYAGNTGYILADYVSATPLTNTEHPDTDAPDTQTPASEENPDSETVSVPPIVDDITEHESDPDASAAIDNEADVVSNLLGTPIVMILAFAILGVLALIAYSVYNLFRRDNTPSEEYDAYYEDNEDEQYYEDEYYEDNENGLYYGVEYYEDNADEQYDEDAYYEDNTDIQYADDEYYQEDESDTTYDDDEYYQEDESDTTYDDEYYQEDESDTTYADDEYYEDNPEDPYIGDNLSEDEINPRNE